MLREGHSRHIASWRRENADRCARIRANSITGARCSPSSIGRPPFATGDLARIHNLQSQPTLNGSIGYVMEYVAPRQRFAVLVGDAEQPILLRPENLEHVQYEDDNDDVL